MPLRVAFFGTPAFAVPTLEHLVALAACGRRRDHAARQAARPRPAGLRRAGQVAGGRARPAGAAAGAARARSVRAQFAALNADIGVVAAYGKILPDWLLATPRLGLINVHASLLPRYRGASPVHRAVINGDRRDRRHDHARRQGARCRPDARGGARADRIRRHDDRSSSRRWRSAAPSCWSRRSMRSTPARRARRRRIESLVTYAPKLAKTEGLHRLVVDRAARSTTWFAACGPGRMRSRISVTMRYILHRSRLSAAISRRAAPGTIVARVGDSRACTSHAATAPRSSLLDIQLEGKRVMSARDAMASKALVAGAQFLPAMIAPARRAAVDALALIEHGDLDMGARSRAARAGAARRTRPRAAARARHRHAADAGGDRLSAGRARQAAARQARRRGPARPADERVPADLPVAAAGVGDHQRCRRADAASRKVERRRPRQCGAAVAVARSRARCRGRRARTIAEHLVDRSSRIRAGWSSAGWRATASRPPRRGSRSTIEPPPCAWRSIAI